MAFAAKQFYSSAAFSNHLQRKNLPSKPHFSSFIPNQVVGRKCEKPNVLACRKRLYISAVTGYIGEPENLRPRDSTIQCNAYEAHRAQPSLLMLVSWATKNEGLTWLVGGDGRPATA
ncbi:unnamed protein product [Fraxinus pennsylvanica]|uniref:Uncharacterized protein n=1 Tax=Fraxinus pennsylvanica TaxID=56036 RepID=A0AAD2EBZ6_9LAMI|nr:unnamed protein product [Fraxinus pennsylvanica]